MQEKLEKLGTLNDEEIGCSDGDESCPYCGSYCNGLTGKCQVDCIAGVANLPPSIPGCGTGEVCTPLGRCAPSTTTPPPPVHALTLQISPLVISGNPIGGAVLVPVTVSVAANSLDFLQPNHPAVVRYRFAQTSAAGATPKIKCSETATPADSCDLSAWAFHVGSGSLVSDPKTIWVQIPQTAEPRQWLLEGRSEWTTTPATASVSAEPVSYPATDPGHYTGTMAWPNSGGPASTATLSVPIEAIVTSSHVALYERSRILLPDGHAVFSRDAAKVTMLGWLSSGSARYDVRFGLGSSSYNSTTGHLNATGTYRTGSLRDSAVTLSLQRTGGTGVAACPATGSCSAGSYCDAAMNLCLPGSGPAAGAGIVIGSSPAAKPSTTLPSARIAAWNGPLTTLVANNSLLLGGSTARQLFERPYCYQAVTQLTPASFARGSALLSPSNDLACLVDGIEQRQLTFELANRQREVGTDAGGAAFNLLNDCIADLDAPPTSSLPANNKCASLSRFLLALRSSPADDIGYRLKTQLLRQWLGVGAYVANSTVQNKDFEDALGTSGQPPATRMAQALDRIDQDLGLLLDPSARTYYAPDNGLATKIGATPDYRGGSRPGARWTFNAAAATIPNAESTTGAGSLTCNTAFLANSRIERGQGATAVCEGSISGLSTVAPGPGGGNWTVVLALDLSPPQTGQFDILSVGTMDSSLWPPFLVPNLIVSGSYGLFGAVNSTLSISLRNWAFGGGTVSFPPIQRDPVNGFGLIAISGSAGTYTLTQVRPGQAATVLPGTPANGGVSPVGDTVSIGSAITGPGATMKLDEISLWDRALAVDDMVAMAARYNFSPANESLPPRAPGTAGSEQAVGLPAHMLEAASSELNLAHAYVDASGSEIYFQCLAGQRTTLDGVLARVGRSLRTVAIIQDEAASVVTAVGTSTPWFARYQADQTQLAGQRAGLIARLATLQNGQCKNPLGIAEEDLPLYVGGAGPSAAERFFAGSRFLANAALSEINIAGGETGIDGLLGQARQSYNASRTSQFQEDQAAHDTADRVLKLSTDYEAQLRRYCGAPPGEDIPHGVFPLVAGFKSGAYTAANCFLRTELTECKNLATMPVQLIPSRCLRGQMGERVLSIQAAVADADNAANAHDRAKAQYDVDMGYCAQLEKDLAGDAQALARHDATMLSITLEKMGMEGSRWSKIKAFASATLEKGWFGIPSQMAFNFGGFDQRIIEEQNAYEEERLTRSNSEQVKACKQKGADQQFAISAAVDTMNRAGLQIDAAAASFGDDANTVVALATEGAGQLALEATISRTPPHLHYWIDQSISAYQAHMAYARRLAYLAVRAYEYESQQSSGLRDDVLNGQLPHDLKLVATTILGATAPFAGRGIDDGPMVLSLRDDILHIQDLSGNSTRVDGSAPLTPTEAFKQLLTSNATKIYDIAGGYVGHGIRFSLRPEAVNAQTCAERLSRIKPAVTIENASQEIAHTRLILAAANTFGSQTCGVAPDDGSLQLARVQPSQSLLVGDAVPSFTNPSAFSTTGLFPLINVARDTLRTMTFPSDDPSAFAGRGYYGEYILIFPDDPKPCTPALCDGWSPDALAKVTDVLLRFDIVEQDNTHL